MMSKCANPTCASVFRYLRDGKLFQVPSGVALKLSQAGTVDTPKRPARDEFFWLCGECSKTFTIVVDPIDGVRIVPRSVPRTMRAAG